MDEMVQDRDQEQKRRSVTFISKEQAMKRHRKQRGSYQRERFNYEKEKGFNYDN